MKSLYSPDVTRDAALGGEESEWQSDGLDDDQLGDAEAGHHHSCAGFTIDGVMASQRLADDRKETIAFGFKHIICEGFVAKAHLFNPESFRWDNDATTRSAHLSPAAATTTALTA